MARTCSGMCHHLPVHLYSRAPTASRIPPPMPTVSLDLITQVHDQRLRRSVFLTTLVVLLYDHLLTVGDEVTYVWTPRLKRSSACFLLFSLFRPSEQPHDGDILPYGFGTRGVLSLRVCAMYGFNLRIFLCLAIAILIAIGLGAWAVIGPENSLETTLLGCHVVTTRPQAIRVAAAWEGQLVCDILILALTLRRAFTDHRSGGLESGSLLRMMVRDGTGTVFRVRIQFWTDSGYTWTGDIITAGNLAWSASAIAVTMMSRLMLNLHEAAFTVDSNTGHYELETLQFQQSERTLERSGMVTAASDVYV
ncbi:hypothetical protein MVEN_02381600 [Mycena venus]|uniref:DUF6533 domain-containing protein n=1 Tax=Mycena venus TaxID=2733690 RepID=A0A8H6X2L1_9AGAR|nr:hypothetical protein MVEN_02381600 [Mycena venus]